MAADDKITWDKANFLWNSNPYTWDDVKVLTAVIEALGAEAPEITHGIIDLEPELRKRFIKLVCKVKGIETYSGQKTIRDDIEVTIEDVELVLEKVLNVNLTVENIHV